jgi:VWFA-related protein
MKAPSTTAVRRSRAVRLVGAAAASFAVVSAGVAQERPPSRVPDLLVPVSTELVRIDVMVTDRSGKPRAGLSERDFVVLEDGQPQKIAQFEGIVGDPALAPSPPPPAPAGDGGKADEPAPERPRPRRNVIIAVDDIHMEDANLLRVKKTLDRFLEREVGEDDLVGLVTTSGTRLHELTDDLYSVRQTVGRLSVQQRSVGWPDVPYLTEYQAELIARGDPEALRVAVEEIQSRRLSGDPEAEAKSKADMVLAEAVENGRRTLEALDNVVRSLSGLQGRKVVALVSDGFIPGLGTHGAAGFDVRRIADAGTRSGVVLYALDTRGIIATSAGRSASSRMPTLTSSFGARDTIERESEHATRDAMSALAADSGGFLVQGANDLGAGLRRVLKDTETYYAVAYEPANTKRDGAFHRIEVRLPGVRDVRIRARKGYFAPDDRKTAKALSVPSANDSRPVREESDAFLETALAVPVVPSALPVRLSADFVSIDGTKAQVAVSARVDLSGVSFAAENDRHMAAVETAAAVFDETGERVATLEPSRAALALTDADYARALENGLDYRALAPLRPGRYRVRLVAREQGSGKLGGATQWVEVPDLSDGRLTLSDLFFLKDADAAPAAGAAPSLRATQAWPRFKRAEKLYVQLFTYNSRKDASGLTSLVAQAEIWQKGVMLAASAPEEIPQGDRDGPQVEHTRSIKLLPFPPGDYEVRLVVTDQNSRQMTSRQAAFVIE